MVGDPERPIESPMSSPDPMLACGRRAFLGGALAAASVAWAAPRRDLVDALAHLTADADDERVALAVREVLLDSADETWRRGAEATARTTLWTRGPVRLEHVALAPSARLAPTSTPGVVSGLRAVAGLARFAHYDPVDDEDDDGVFVVQRTRQGVLVPGRIVDRTTRRDTIREVRAGRQGAEWLEVTVTRSERAPRVVDVAHTPHDAFAGLHAARWLHDADDAAR